MIKGTDKRKSNKESHRPTLDVDIWCLSCCHSAQRNVFTSRLSRAGLLWQAGTVGWLEDEMRYSFIQSDIPLIHFHTERKKNGFGL